MPVIARFLASTLLLAPLGGAASPCAGQAPYLPAHFETVRDLPPTPSGSHRYHLAAAHPSRWVAAPSRRSYWLEGGIIGAVVVGVPSAFLAHSICLQFETSACRGSDYLLGGVVGGAVGFGLGALVGLAIHKS
jgi:hypothetical protein